MKLLKLTPFIGMGFFLNSYYQNNLRPVPPDPKIHEMTKKKIIIVGGGIIGLSTAYFLSKNM